MTLLLESPDAWPPKKPGMYSRPIVGGWETVWVCDMPAIEFAYMETIMYGFGEFPADEPARHEFRP